MEFLLMMLLSLVFIVIGFLIWKKGMITLIHNYHYTKVREQEKSKYCEVVGKGCILIGLGPFFTGIVELNSVVETNGILIIIFMILGLSTLYYAQRKYNGGIF